MSLAQDNRPSRKGQDESGSISEAASTVAGQIVQAMPEPPAPVQSTVDRLRDFLSQEFTAAFCAGGVAGAVSRTVVSPLERLKILYQVQSAGRNEYQMSVGRALAKMWRDEGWRGFMRGNGTNCIRIVPYSAVQFGSFNLYRRGVESQTGTPLTSLQRLVCGGIAGITSVTMTYPLDIVRTRLSIQTASFASLREKKVGKPPGMWPVMKTMYQTEGGMRGLYKGILPTIAGVAPYVGLNFMVYEQVRGYFTDPGEKNPVWYRKLAAGAISGAVAQTCTYPFDVLRRRFQVNAMSGMGYQYKGLGDAITTIIKQEGFLGLYKGIAPNLLKVAPSMASSWLSFEMTRDYLVSLRSDVKEPI